MDMLIKPEEEEIDNQEIGKKTTSREKNENLRSGSRKLNLALKKFLFTELSAPSSAFRNQMGLQWRNMAAAEQAHLISERLQDQPYSIDKHAHGVVKFRPDRPGIHSIMVADRSDLNELPFPHFDCVTLFLDRLIKTKHAKELHLICNSVRYNENEQQLEIAGNTWGICVVIASCILEFNEGAICWIDAREKIAVRNKLVMETPEILSILESYIIA